MFWLNIVSVLVCGKLEHVETQTIWRDPWFDCLELFLFHCKGNRVKESKERHWTSFIAWENWWNRDKLNATERNQNIQVGKYWILASIIFYLVNNRLVYLVHVNTWNTCWNNTLNFLTHSTPGKGKYTLNVRAHASIFHNNSHLESDHTGLKSYLWECIEIQQLNIWF